MAIKTQRKKSKGGFLNIPFLKKIIKVSWGTRIAVPSLIALIAVSGYLVSNLYLFRMAAQLRQRNIELKLLSSEEAKDDSLIDFITKHMMNDPRSLVVPEDKSIQKLAEKLGYDPFKLYDFVKFKVKYDPNEIRYESGPATLGVMRSNCFGNSSLLVSLLRASGLKPNEVHVTVGLLVGDKVHAWVEVRSEGHWIMMDPTSMIGKPQERWIIPRRSFYQGWKVSPQYDFNDQIFRFRKSDKF